jgi:hypothetical protein
MESYDPPPPGPPEADLVEVRHTQPSNGGDLRRADDPSAGAVYDRKAAVWATIDSAAVFGPVN